MHIVLTTHSKLQNRVHFRIAQEVWCTIHPPTSSQDTRTAFSSYLILPFTLSCLVNLKIKLIFIGQELCKNI